MSVYILGLFMRRIFSITAIVTLMYPVVSPLLAACPHVQQHAPACHRVQQAQAAHHHCDAKMMTHQDQTEAVAPGSDAPAVQAVASPANCPMDCCGASAVTNAAAVAATTSLPLPAVIEQSRNFVSVAFTSAGFSSHTDRGPPAA
jgi:hypothetical protein